MLNLFLRFYLGHLENSNDLFRHVTINLLYLRHGIEPNPGPEYNLIGKGKINNMGVKTS